MSAQDVSLVDEILGILARRGVPLTARLVHAVDDDGRSLQSRLALLIARWSAEAERRWSDSKFTCQGEDARAAWLSCRRPDWLAWLCVRVGADGWRVTRVLWSCLHGAPAATFFEASSFAEGAAAATADRVVADWDGRSPWERREDAHVLGLVEERGSRETAEAARLLPAHVLGLAAPSLRSSPRACSPHDAGEHRDRLFCALRDLVRFNLTLLAADDLAGANLAGRAAAAVAWVDTADLDCYDARKRRACDALRAAFTFEEVLKALEERAR